MARLLGLHALRAQPRSAFTNFPSHTQQRAFSPRVWARKRPGQPLRKKSPEYQLSDLILDLDAYESKHVRAFDKHDLADQAQRWTKIPHVEESKARVAEMQAEIDGQLARAGHVATDKGSRWKLTDSDVFAVALLGGENVQAIMTSGTTIGCGDAKAVKEYHTLTALWQNGVPDLVLDGPPDQVMRFALHRQKKYDGFMAAGDLRPALAACEDIHQLRRVLSRYLRDEAGCKLFALGSSMGADVSKCVGRLRSNENDKDLLMLLNNVNIRVSKYHHPGRFLWTIGLELASSMKDVHGMLRYAQGSIQYSSTTDLKALDECLSSLDTTQVLATAAEDGILTQLLNLLVGDNSSPNTTGRSVRHLIEPQREHLGIYCNYVRLLGRLGASRTLWHEWVQRVTWPRESMAALEDVFADAALLAPKVTLVDGRGSNIDNASRIAEAADTKEGDTRLDAQDLLGLESRRMEEDFDLQWDEMIGQQSEKYRAQVKAALNDGNIVSALSGLKAIVKDAQTANVCRTGS